MQEIILVAESGADITPETARRLGIEIVPMHVSFGSDTLPDGTFPVQKIYDYYASTRALPKTSGSSPEDFTAAFDEIHSRRPDAHILHLAYSAVTTVSYQSAVIAAQGRDYVTSIDTKQVSAGQGAVAVKTAEWMSSHPEATLGEVMEEVKRLMDKVRMCFLPGDLSYLRAGGRVSNAQYLGAQVLRLHPLIEIVGGKLMSTRKYIGNMTRVSSKLIREYGQSEKLRRDWLIMLKSAPVEEEYRLAVEACARDEGFKEISWVHTGCVVSTHCGPGAFGLVGFSE